MIKKWWMCEKSEQWFFLNHTPGVWHHVVQQCSKIKYQTQFKTMTASCSTLNYEQDNGILLNVHNFCTKGEHCYTEGISAEYHYSHDIHLAFIRLYAKGYKHWQRPQNLAASLSPPPVLQLCGINPMSCSNLIPKSEITVCDFMGQRPPYKQHSTNTKKHTHIHTCDVCSKGFWAYYTEHNTYHINFITDRSLQNSPLLYDYKNSKALTSLPKI